MQGRSPTCYSPVRHSCTPKGLTVRLACVKHAASVRPEPESNSPNKNQPSLFTKGSQNGSRVKHQSEKSDQATRKNLAKQSHPDTGVPECNQKQKQQTKTTKHTIEFSNNTPGTTAWPHNRPAAFKPRLRRADNGTLRIPELFPGVPPRSAA